MTVGERIKELREKQNLSQGDLAKMMGVSRQAISKAELHDSNITMEKVRKFAKALKCSEAYLMGWEDNSQPNDEEKILEIYRSLNEESKRQLVLMLAFLKDQDNKK